MIHSTRKWKWNDDIERNWKKFVAENSRGHGSSSQKSFHSLPLPLYLIQARKLSILSESLRAVSTSETKHWETPLGTITINWEELSLRELSRRGKMRRTKETRRRFQMRMTKERWMQSMQEGDEEGVQAQRGVYIDKYHNTPSLKVYAYLSQPRVQHSKPQQQQQQQ